MKTKVYITFLLTMGVCVFAKAQKTESTNTKIQKEIDQTGNFNLLDAQAGILGDIFGKQGGVSEFQGIENYNDLIKDIEDPKLKKELKKQYQIYSTTNNPSKKDSIASQMQRRIEEAIKNKKNNSKG